MLDREPVRNGRGDCPTQRLLPATLLCAAEGDHPCCEADHDPEEGYDDERQSAHTFPITDTCESLISYIQRCGWEECGQGYRQRGSSFPAVRSQRTGQRSEQADGDKNFHALTLRRYVPFAPRRTLEVGRRQQLKLLIIEPNCAPRAPLTRPSVLRPAIMRGGQKQTAEIEKRQGALNIRSWVCKAIASCDNYDFPANSSAAAAHRGSVAIP